jgi:hypothetical protein
LALHFETAQPNGQLGSGQQMGLGDSSAIDERPVSGADVPGHQRTTDSVNLAMAAARPAIRKANVSVPASANQHRQAQGWFP